MDYKHQITFKGLFLLASFSSTLAAVTTSYRTIMVSDHSEYLVNGYDLELTCTSDRFNTNVFDMNEFTSSAGDILVICVSGPSSCTIGPSVNGRSSLSVWSNGTLLRLEDYDVAIDAQNFICDDRDRSETFSESAITVCDAPTSVMIDVSCNRNSDEVTVLGSSDISNCNLYPTIFITINGEESQCTQETCTFNIPSDPGEYNIEVFGALFNVTSGPQEPCTVTVNPTSEPLLTDGEIAAIVVVPTCAIIVVIAIVVVSKIKEVCCFRGKDDEENPEPPKHKHGSRSVPTSASGVAVSEGSKSRGQPEAKHSIKEMSDGSKSPGRPLPTGPQGGGRVMLPPIESADGVEKKKKKKKKKKKRVEDEAMDDYDY